MPNVSEQEIRAYLLGGLSPEQHSELAAAIHNDAELQEELLAIQEELFDQYLAGSFTSDEQQYFKTHFLSSESGQRKLRFATLFRKYRDNDPPKESFAEDRVPAPIPPVPAPSPWFVGFHRNPAYAVSMILVAGLLAALIGWVAYMRKSPTMTIPPTRMAALTLSAGANGSGGSIKKLRTPAQNDEVKVELELSKSDFKKYKTQLFRENQALASQEELPIVSKNTHYVVPVTFTGNLLTPGDYQLKLSGVPDSGQPTYIDVYSFRVTDENASDPDQEQNRITR
ncbi:MAG TPA: hypothetical protein VJS13_16170 [Pyrinomonadaceae bacterium]|nr:hypothetical protein [Pyrinomonadaceae bacterium]